MTKVLRSAALLVEDKQCNQKKDAHGQRLDIYSCMAHSILLSHSKGYITTHIISDITLLIKSHFMNYYLKNVSESDTI